MGKSKYKGTKWLLNKPGAKAPVTPKGVAAWWYKTLLRYYGFHVGV